MAYIALSKESIPLSLPTVEESMIGCRILEIYVKPIYVNNNVVDNVALRVALLDETEHHINGWVNTVSLKFEFDYFWFYNVDIKKKEIIDEIGSMTTIGNLSFKMVNRHTAI